MCRFALCPSPQNLETNPLQFPAYLQSSDIGFSSGKSSDFFRKTHMGTFKGTAA